MLSPLLTQATGVHAVKGEGAYLYGPEGDRYLDFTAGIGVTSTGHCHPKVVHAAQQQVASLIHGQYTTVMHPRLLELSERLETVMPGDIDSFFYASAGTEAVEATLRLARHATGRTNVIVFQGGFHGRTMGSLSMTTSKNGLRAGLEPMMAGVFVAPFPYPYHYGWDEQTTVEFCIKQFDHLLATQTAPDETAAVYLEPVLGEGGYVPATAEFAKSIRRRCDAHGMLLVMDEIQTGIGRTGKFWGLDHLDVTPDMVITAKGLASGFPLSAFGAPRALMAKGRPGSQGGTYGGNAVACAAALATLDVVKEEGLVENADARGKQLAAELQDAMGNLALVGEIRGRGLMVGIELIDADGNPNGDLSAKARKRAGEMGLLLLPCGAYGQVVRFIPPLIVDENQISSAVQTFTTALAESAG